MPIPAVLGRAATGTTGVWIPDWMQTPFSVGIALVASGGAGSATVEFTLDNLQTTSVASAQWFTAILSAVSTVANFSTPCQGFRVNVGTSVATTVFTATFVQATFPR